jgi:hypothetical protein
LRRRWQPSRSTRTKDIFVKKHGEEVYEEKMSALVDDLLASEVNEDEIKGTAESIIG